MKVLSVLASAIIQPFTTLRATTAYILGTADTSGVRLDLESGALAVREGDDSAYGDVNARTVTGSGEGIFTGNVSTDGVFRDLSTGNRLDLSVSAGARIANNGATNTCDITLADWGTTLSAEAVSVADAAVLQGPATAIGTLTIALGTDNHVGVFALTNNGAPVELNDPGTFFSVTKDTPSSVNVYYESGAYRIQNLRGGSRAMRILLIGG